MVPVVSVDTRRVCFWVRCPVYPSHCRLPATTHEGYFRLTCYRNTSLSRAVVSGRVAGKMERSTPFSRCGFSSSSGKAVIWLFRFASCHVVSALSHFYVESFWVFLLSPVSFLLVGSVRPSFGNPIQSHIQINPRKTQVQILRPHINPHPLRDFAMMMMDLVSTLLLGGTPGGTPFSLTEMCGQSWARCQQLQFCPRHAVASWTYTLPALRNPHRTSASGGARLWFGF